jgi:hypothetical protein
MIPVKTQPRFKCDFCNHRSTKFAMEKHERRCWANPNRYCENCENKGYVEEDLGEGTEYSKIVDRPCEYCEKVKQIKERVEKEKKSIESLPSVDISEIPF